MNILNYKGYLGQFEYDPEADIFHGEVMNLADVITFQGRSIDELRQALADSVDDYLEFCAEKGRKPEKPYSGRFNVRINPELHQRIALKAAAEGKSLNLWVADALDQAAEVRNP
jgi:predicted HicB family RNase H-like nuclease